MALILLVDDDHQFRDMLQSMLERLGHEVVIAQNGKEALSRWAERRADLVITDLIMPEKEGLELIRELHRSAIGVPIIAMSGGGRTSPATYLKLAGNLGAAAVLAKPFTFSQLSAAIESAWAVS